MSFNPEEFAPKKRRTSAEETARIAAAQKRRWAAHKASAFRWHSSAENCYEENQQERLTESGEQAFACNCEEGHNCRGMNGLTQS